MRIRTLKPDFWKHQIMAQQRPEVRLLAIGLLNLADDEGYFMAHPALIRGELMPFLDKPGPIQQMLNELEAIGYLTLSRLDDGRDIGHITNFKKHQVVNKATRSRIKALLLTDSGKPTSGLLEDSGSTTVVIQEGSRGEWNREGKGKEEERERDAPGGGPMTLEQAHEHAKRWCLSSPAMIAYDPLQVEMWHADRERKSWQSSAGQIIETVSQATKDLQFWLLRNKTSTTPDSMNGFGPKKNKGGAAQEITEAPLRMIESPPEGYEAAMVELWGEGWQDTVPAWAQMVASDKAQVRKWLAQHGKEAA